MPQIIKISQIPPIPWKNAGGTTTEIYRQSFANYEFALRISVASVEKSGPFSIFPKVSRAILLLAGSGIKLQINKNEIIELKNKFIPVFFSGDDQVDCELLNGPIKDFNLMVHQDYGVGNLEVKNYKPNQVINFVSFPQKFIFLASGEVSHENKKSISETLWILKKDEQLQLKTLTNVDLIEITIYPHKIHSEEN